MNEFKPNQALVRQTFLHAKSLTESATEQLGLESTHFSHRNITFLDEAMDTVKVNFGYDPHYDMAHRSTAVYNLAQRALGRDDTLQHTAEIVRSNLRDPTIHNLQISHVRADNFVHSLLSPRTPSKGYNYLMTTTEALLPGDPAFGNPFAKTPVEDSFNIDTFTVIDQMHRFNELQPANLLIDRDPEATPEQSIAYGDRMRTSLADIFKQNHTDVYNSTKTATLQLLLGSPADAALVDLTLTPYRKKDSAEYRDANGSFTVSACPTVTVEIEQSGRKIELKVPFDDTKALQPYAHLHSPWSSYQLELTSTSELELLAQITELLSRHPGAAIATIDGKEQQTQFSRVSEIAVQNPISTDSLSTSIKAFFDERT